MPTEKRALVNRWRCHGVAAALCLSALGCIGTAGSGDVPPELEPYIVDATPPEMVPLNISFDGKISLLGVDVKADKVLSPGSRVRLKMYWKVHEALDDPSWKLFTHVMNANGKRLLNVDNVGPLRRVRNGEQALAPGRWEKGKIYIDTQSFTVPRRALTDKLQVAVGIWKQSIRLPVKGGPSLDKDRGLVATLDVDVPPKPPAVPVLEPMRLPPGVALTMDGELNEPAWQSAASTGPFVSVSTGKVDPNSKVQGQARVLWDDTALFVGFEVQDEDVRGDFDVEAKDPHLWTQDCVELMIDPDGNGDNKDYYEIQINPQNLVFDSQFDGYNRPVKQPDGPFGHEQWSANLQSAVAVHGTLNDASDKDQGYTVELRVPWASFDKARKTPPRPQQRWRMNLYAMQDNGGVAWSPILGLGNFHKASRFGAVRWLTHVDQTTAAKRQRAAERAARRKNSAAKAAKRPPQAVSKPEGKPGKAPKAAE